MKANRQVLHDNKAQANMIGAAIGTLITIIICVLIYYNIAGSTYSTVTINADQAKTTYGQAVNASKNATDNINSQAATFFTIAPIVAVVIVAVVVISYVKQIG